MSGIKKIIIVTRQDFEKKEFTGTNLQVRVDDQGTLLIYERTYVVAAFPSSYWWAAYPEGQFVN